MVNRFVTVIFCLFEIVSFVKINAEVSVQKVLIYDTETKTSVAAPLWAEKEKSYLCPLGMPLYLLLTGKPNGDLVVKDDIDKTQTPLELGLNDTFILNTAKLKLRSYIITDQNNTVIPIEINLVPIPDSISIPDTSNLRINEPVTLQLFQTRYPPNDIYIVDDSGSSGHVTSILSDSKLDRYLFRYRFNQQPKNCFAQILLPEKNSYPVLMKQSTPTGIEFEATFQPKVKVQVATFQPAQNPVITFNLNNKSVNIFTKSDYPVHVKINATQVALQSNNVLKYLQSTNTPVCIKKSDDDIIAKITRDYPSPDTFSLTIIAEKTNEGDPMPYFEYSDGTKKQKVNVNLKISGFPDIDESNVRSSYQPGDTVTIKVLGDNKICDLYELTDCTGKINLSFSDGAYKSNVPITLPCGKYPLIWRRIGEKIRENTLNRTGITLAIAEFNNIVRLSNYVQVGGKGNNEVKNAPTISSSELDNISISFNQDCIGINQGPQFLHLRVSYTEKDGKTVIITDRTITTFNKNDSREKLGKAYTAYLASIATNGIKIPYVSSCKIGTEGNSIPAWSTVRLQIAPDSVFCSQEIDQSKRIDKYFLVSGSPIKAKLQIGIPGILGYYVSDKNKQKDTIDLDFKPASGALLINYIYRGKPFFISTGIGAYPFNINPSLDSTVSGIGVAFPISFDFIRLIDYFGVSIPDNAGFSFDVSPVFPFTLKTKHSSKEYDIPPRVLFSFTISLGQTL